MQFKKYRLRQAHTEAIQLTEENIEEIHQLFLNEKDIDDVYRNVDYSVHFGKISWTHLGEYHKATLGDWIIKEKGVYTTYAGDFEKIFEKDDCQEDQESLSETITYRRVSFDDLSNLIENDVVFYEWQDGEMIEAKLFSTTRLDSVLSTKWYTREE